MKTDEITKYRPYESDKNAKREFLTEQLITLTEKHRAGCPEYGKILESINYNKNKVDSYEDLPFLPVRLFKEMSLKSVPDEEIVKTMTSSGTSGQAVSKIYLDRNTAANQQKAMVKIVSDFTGSSRMPMIIIDCPSVVKNRTMFSARGAGILGFSIFGSKKIYALDDDMKLNVDGIRTFLNEHKGEKIFLFGFTFMIWKYFYKELMELRKHGIALDLSDAVMIHGGGWKKLISEAVSPEMFHTSLKEICGLDRIHDYYGMVEQTGSIYMQCECGHLHASIFSDIIIRKAKDFSICNTGEPGLIQVVSTIPESYPGHSLLTEDEGIFLGEDDCPCGRKGKYFQVLGRIKNAEIRGCSDTYDINQNNGISGLPDNSGEVSKQKKAVPDKIKYLVGSKENIEHITSVPSKQRFEEQILEFCNALSQKLMGDHKAKAFPDVITFGFWLRKSSLSRMKERFSGNDCAGGEEDNIVMGRGTVFHIAPSNVPVNFAYSLFSGLLTGNSNIVRVPSGNFTQVEIICNAVNYVLKDYPDLKPYINLVRYDRDRSVNDYFSALCDVRIIWGGDATIEELRLSELPPRSTDITFADRYSLAVIDADDYLRTVNKDKIALDFYNDTYLSDQNACTSPRAVVWNGEDKTVAEAKEIFWGKLHELAEKKYLIQPVQCVDKLVMEYISAVRCAAHGMHEVQTSDNLIVRIQTDSLTDTLMNYRGNSGYFYEYDMKNVRELWDICNNVHCQTIGLLGNKEILRPLIMSGIKGIDRIVPVGQTMDFDLFWDGYNLADRLTRTIVVKRER